MGSKRPRSEGRGIKQALREHTWKALKDAGAARFPGARGRIPNFTGAEKAATQLAANEAFINARTIKCNPDSPQRPVRHAALKAGKLVYMPAPRLAEAHPFIELDPTELDDLWHASSIKGAFELGRPVTLDEIPSIDLIITGCVAVTRNGARLGKGGGYSDLEYGLLRELGKVTADTPIATTVHSVQVLEDGAIPVERHDISLDVIATADEVWETQRPFERPAGIDWDALDAEKRAAIPVLR